MISKNIEVNGKTFRLTLTDQVIAHVNNLKSLYEKVYEDPESFDQISSEVSSTINEIALSVEPEASDGDLDGLMQEIIKTTDNKKAEMQSAMSDHEGKPKSKRSRSRK